MESAIGRKRALPAYYQLAARVVGWALLAGGMVWLLVFVFSILAAVDAAGEMRWPGLSRNAVYATLTFLLSFAAPGCFALLIAQFIRYTSETEGKTGWLLAHGAWFFYGCALVLATQAALKLAGWELPVVTDPDRAGLLYLGPSLVPLMAKVLICIGLGHVLGRILPVIGESKTLV
ncbi:MAG: hypothetical protein JSW27_17775 [Phycisphaerales bacterium]|nr:MAG: hypothetical protein JSW27_17775 [Phycisphaerales bacterium]